MSALPRPVLTGPARVLNDALHDLHHRAGWPSLRTLAKETGVSHTTVSKTFSRPGIPSWGTLELLVEAMDGPVQDFRELWLAASTPTDGAPAPAPRIAGRRAELDVVRRHLETGTGLLIVTGEAGIGKTTLVASAAATTDVTVARGACLPLSTEIPLLAAADCLRSAYEADPPGFVQVVDACPPFVAPAVSSLVPELGVTSGDGVRADDRVLLLSAVASLLKALSDTGRTVLVLEDLHWSDPATLDLLEHLVGRTSVPLVGTWRSGDPATPGSTQEWFERVRRLRDTTVVALGALSRDETAHQLALLGADTAQVDVIHGRSRGQPLFTEQLAAHLDDEAGLPDILADLLDRRLVGLSGPAWSVVRALGLAERPLPTAPLATVCGLAGDDLTSVLHELRARRLLRTSTDEHAELEHPLLAEAVQRRLVAGERRPVHRALARALGARPDPEAAEVAEHWRRAGEPAEELGWRVSAARRAAERFDRRQEAEHWLRVIEIWPADGSLRPDTPVTRAEALVGAMDALRASFRFGEAAALSEVADECLAEADDGDRADLLFRRSIYRGDPEGFESGLALLDEALAIHDRLPVREGKVRALDRKQLLLFAMGRSAESRAVADEEVVAARELGNPVLLRDALMRVAWHTGIAGDVDRGLALLTSAGPDSGARDDPLGDVRLGVYATDMLLTTGAPPDAVVAAGRPALAVAREHDFDNPQVMLVRVNVAFSLLHGGRVAEAEQVVATPSDAPWDADHWPLHAARAVIDSRLGLAEAATSRIAEICAEPSSSAPRDLEFLRWATDAALWTGSAQPGLDHVVGQLDDVAGTAPVRLVAPALVAAARLASHREAHQHLEPLRDLAGRCGLVGVAGGDDANLAAQRASLLADTAALAGSESVATWTAAATAWDRLEAPHDAAYCRWRAARCALRDGRGTLASRLLARAAADAREHVPLSRAIAATAAAGP